MKRILSAIVFIVMCFTVAVLCAKAEEGMLNYNISWKLEDGVLTVSGYGEIPQFSVIGTAARYVKQKDGKDEVKGASSFNSAIESAEKIVIDDGITSIGAYVFSCCKAREIILPNTLEKIGEYAFYCADVEETALPESLTYIGDMAFSGANVSNYFIPKNVTYIGVSAFHTDVAPHHQTTVPVRRGKTARVDVSEENSVYASVDGVLYDKDIKTLIYFPIRNENERFIIPDTVTQIGIKGRTPVFESRYFEEVRIPEGVRALDIPGTFRATVIEKIYIPKSMEKIDNSALKYPQSDGRLYVTYGSIKEIHYAGSRDDWEKITLLIGGEPIDEHRAEIEGVSKNADYLLGDNMTHWGEVIEGPILYYGEVPFADEISVKINGEYLGMDVFPVIKDGRTLVPLRVIFRALGATVTWDDDKKCAVAVKKEITRIEGDNGDPSWLEEETEIRINIGENVLCKNYTSSIFGKGVTEERGEEIALDAPAEIVNDRTMVPVRAVAEAFGAEVSWDNETKSVIITMEE